MGNEQNCLLDFGCINEIVDALSDCCVILFIAFNYNAKKYGVLV